MRHPSRSAQPDRFTVAGGVRRELHTRAMMAVLPALLVWVRWTALTRPRRRRESLLPTGFATATVMATFFPFYFLGINFEAAVHALPGTGQWLPIAVFLLLGVIQSWWPQRSPDRSSAHQITSS